MARACAFYVGILRRRVSNKILENYFLYSSAVQSPVSDFLCDEHLPAHAMQRFKHMPILYIAGRVVGAGVYSQEDTIYILFNPCPNPPIRFNNKGAYYHLPGTGSGANKWYVHHQGGGWCESLDDCLSRSKVRTFVFRFHFSLHYFTTIKHLHLLVWSVAFRISPGITATRHG